MNASDRWINNATARRKADHAAADEYRTVSSKIRSGTFPEPAKLPVNTNPAVPEGAKILCIGDSHANPDFPNWRYEWLGRFATDHKPDVIWDCGDWVDMQSLSSYEHSYENLRYWRDIESGIDAQLRFRAQIEDYNRGRRRDSRYTPRLIRTLGNHEARITKTVERLSSTLQGILSTDDLLSREFGWEEHPFGEPVLVAGFALCHYFVSGVMGRAIGGENPAATLLKKQFHSCLQGHSHLLDYADRTNASGRGIMAMHAGCYFDYENTWAGQEVNRMYARGLLLLHNARDGMAEPEWWGLDRIRARYS